jgi:hypothetical protein
MENAVNDVLQTVNSRPGKLVSLRVGVVCPTYAGGKVGRALHDKVLGCLKS